MQEAGRVHSAGSASQLALTISSLILLLYNLATLAILPKSFGDGRTCGLAPIALTHNARVIRGASSSAFLHPFG
jgi:hypothetical protein